MNRNKESVVFDLSKAEQAVWLANMISEFQAKGVKYTLDKDANLVYVRPE